MKRQQNVMTKHDLSLFDLELWTTTSPYYSSLAKVNPDTKIRSKVKQYTNEQTGKQIDTTKHYFPTSP